MDRRMMNEWLKAQAQKQQLTERSFQQKRLGVAITEQLTPKEEKFAKANRHVLSEMVKRYGSDKGTQLFYSSVREQVKKLNEETSTSRGEPYGEPPIERPKFRNVNPPPAQPLPTSQDGSNVVPTSQEERDDTSGTTTGVPVMRSRSNPQKLQAEIERRNWEQRQNSNSRETFNQQRRAEDTKMSQRPQRPQPAPQPAP